MYYSSIYSVLTNTQVLESFVLGPPHILKSLRVRSESLNVREQRTEVQVRDDRSGLGKGY